MKQREKKTIEIELGNSFWWGIAFAGGVFTNNWIPFLVLIVLDGIIYLNKNE